jgi:hypothetical protein
VREVANVDDLEQQIFDLLDRRAEIEPEWQTRAHELEPIDRELDDLYRQLDNARGTIYVPRFRNFERSSALKISELADAVRRLAERLDRRESN